MRTLGERVKAEREAKGWSQQQLAEAVTREGYRIGQSGIGNIESRGVTAPRCIVQLASVLGVNVEWLQNEKGEKYARQGSLLPQSEALMPMPSRQLAARSEPRTPPPPSTFVSTAPLDVPVYGTVRGGEAYNADFEFNGQIVDYVRRPEKLMGRADVFALYVIGTSMSPWREPGELAYIEQIRTPRAGDYVVIELTPRRGDTVRPALVKKLLNMTPSKLKLQQYQPAKEFDLEMAKVAQLHRVIPWDELVAR